MTIPIQHGSPTYDVAGMPIIGHPTPLDKLTLDGGQTADPSGETLVAGTTYRIWGDANFCYVLAASSPVADNADVPVFAGVPEYVTPKADMLISVIDLGSSGNVWIAKMERYGE
jgi:hypothetical protein